MVLRRTFVARAALVAALSVSGFATSAYAQDAANLRVWFMQDSVSDKAAEWLTNEFAAQNPGSTLTIEVQPWTDIVSRLLTSLASKSETPDIVEIGNTKSTTFASVGALADLTDMYQSLGGDNLIPSFVKAGTVNDKIYAYPLYAGVSVIFYRKDLFEKAGIKVPATLDELVDAAAAVQAANPDKTEGFKGMYFPVTDTHGLESWLFSHDANYAKQVDGKWVSGLSDPGAHAALEQLQKLWTNSSLGALDARETANNPWVPYNNGEVGIFSFRAFAQKNISPEMAAVTGTMALPPVEAGGQSHQFMGGSNVAIAANSSHQDLAKKALTLIMSKEFQSQLAADAGWVPGNTTFADAIPNGLVPNTLQQQIAQTSGLTPAAKNWAIVEGNNLPIDLYTGVAKGENIDDVTARIGAGIEKVLNSD